MAISWLRFIAKLEKEWSPKYSVEYDSRKAAFEYSIKMLHTVFKSFTENIATEYTNYMNRWFTLQHWYFDKEKMSFEERLLGGIFHSD